MSDIAASSRPHQLLFQAIANPTRMQIMHLLREKERLTVSQICSELAIEQTQISHALRTLASCGVVRVTSQGKSRLYSLTPETMFPLLELADYHVTKYASNLRTSAALKR